MVETQSSRREWMVGIACAVGMMMDFTTLFVGTFSLFIQPICKELGWSRALVSSGLTVDSLVIAVLCPFIGRAVDRWGVRRFVLPGMVVYAINLMAFSQLTSSHGRLYLIFGLLGVDAAFIGLVPLTKVVSATFFERRGLMLGVLLGGTRTLTIAALIPIVRYLIIHYGWRNTYVILGSLVLLIGFPVLLAFLKEPDITKAVQRSKSEPLPVQDKSLGVTTGEAVASRSFWLIIIPFLLTNSTVNSFMAHSYVFFTGRGISGVTAATLISTIAVGRFAGQVLSGFLLDKIQTPRIGILLYSIAFMGLLMMDYGRGVYVFPAVFLLGFGSGQQMSVSSYFVSRYFGLRAFAGVSSLIGSTAAIGSAAGYVLMGMCYDHFGSYQVGIHVGEINMLMSTILVGLIGPYVYAARRPGKQQQQQPLVSAAGTAK